MTDSQCPVLFSAFVLFCFAGLVWSGAHQIGCGVVGGAYAKAYAHHGFRRVGTVVSTAAVVVKNILAGSL